MLLYCSVPEGSAGKSHDIFIFFPRTCHMTCCTTCHMTETTKLATFSIPDPRNSNHACKGRKSVIVRSWNLLVEVPSPTLPASPRLLHHPRSGIRFTVGDLAHYLWCKNISALPRQQTGGESNGTKQKKNLSFWLNWNGTFWFFCCCSWRNKSREINVELPTNGALTTCVVWFWLISMQKVASPMVPEGNCCDGLLRLIEICREQECHTADVSFW